MQKILSNILVLCFFTCYVIPLMSLSPKAGAVDYSPLTPKSSSRLKKIQFTTKIPFLLTSRHLEAISCQFCNRSAVKNILLGRQRNRKRQSRGFARIRSSSAKSSLPICKSWGGGTDGRDCSRVFFLLRSVFWKFLNASIINFRYSNQAMCF